MDLDDVAHNDEKARYESPHQDRRGLQIQLFSYLHCKNNP